MFAMLLMRLGLGVPVLRLGGRRRGQDICWSIHRRVCEGQQDSMQNTISSGRGTFKELPLVASRLDSVHALG